MAPVTRHKYCFLDIDINDHRSKLALGAAFVHATDSRYGFSSSDVRKLGGSELSRIKAEGLIEMDHDFGVKVKKLGGYSLSHDPETDGGRIVVELFWDIAPMACENFMTLAGTTSYSDGCKGNVGKSVPRPVIGVCGKPLSYTGSIIHRVVPGFIMQGGDFVMSNGSGGESIFSGKKFKDERSGLQLHHHSRGILSMGNSGKNSNSSQFFITFQPTPQCDGKHVIFGQVRSGFDVLDCIEKTGEPGGGGEPNVSVKITNSGIFEPLSSPGQGYLFDQPDDSYNGSTPYFMCRPRVLVVAPSDLVAKKFKSILSPSTSVSLIVHKDEHCTKNTVEIALTTYAIDFAIFAPPCKDQIPNLHSLSGYENVNSHEILMVAKPIDSLKALRASTWFQSRDWYFT
mmetsp:Transcript_12739/g.16628  ORF Transcript_12739/g.16628 Transcript_12739/m.16628 type:complete len:399 (+) Transcript_12739:344-1540(+)